MNYVIIDTSTADKAQLTHAIHVDSVHFKNFILPVYRGAAYQLAVGEELPEPNGEQKALRRID